VPSDEHSPSSISVFGDPEHPCSKIVTLPLHVASGNAQLQLVQLRSSLNVR
jgi:hypothetical protein